MAIQLTYLLTNIFNKVNIKVTLVLYIFLCLTEWLGLKWIWVYDPGDNPKYTLLCNIGLLIYSIWTGYLVKQRLFMYFLPSLLVPISVIAMEWVNYKTILRFDFYSQLSIYMLIGIAWNIFCYLLLSSCKLTMRLKTIFGWIQSILETLLFIVVFSIMINARINGTFNGDAVVAICQTNVKEAWHYFWGINHGVLLCLLIIPFACFVSYVMLILRFTRIPLNSISQGDMFMKAGMTGLLILFWGICVFANFFSYFPPLSWQTIKAYNYYYVQIEHYQALIKKRQELTTQFMKQQEHKAIQGKDGIFVFIIGESLDRRYMGCYDHQRKTTPFQSTLRQSHNAIFYDRAYACHVQTTRVLPMMLTFYNQYLDVNTYSEAELSLSLLDIAKCNKYKVYWFSNQEKMSNSNSIISSLAASADVSVFMQDLYKDDCFDEKIVQELEKQIFEKRSLVIIHLMGNHYPYGMTYPKNFQFPQNFDTYEKSVFYNDWVLKNIADYFSKHNLAAMVYVSDHADAVSLGKGHDPRPEKFVKEMVEIPLWFYFSPDYHQTCPELFDMIDKSRNKYITNDLLYNLFQNLMNLNNTFSPEQFSPVSPDYILNQQKPLTLDRQLIIENPDQQE